MIAGGVCLWLGVDGNRYADVEGEGGERAAQLKGELLVMLIHSNDLAARPSP